MNIPIIRDLISFTEAKKIAQEYYPDLVKDVVDINRRILAIGGEMHVDAEEVLLIDGSKQSDLWDFNILMDKGKENCLVYESFINIRPRDNNKDLEVQNPEIRNKMKEIIFERINFD